MATKLKQESEHSDKGDRATRRSLKVLKVKPKEVAPALAVMDEVTAETLIGEHRRLWQVLRVRLDRCLSATEEVVGIDELKFTKAAGDLLATIVKGERVIWGIDDIVLEGEVDETDEVACEMVRVTSPPGTEEALERE